MIATLKAAAKKQMLKTFRVERKPNGSATTGAVLYQLSYCKPAGSCRSTGFKEIVRGGVFPVTVYFLWFGFLQHLAVTLRAFNIKQSHLNNAGRLRKRSLDRGF